MKRFSGIAAFVVQTNQEVRGDRLTGRHRGRFFVDLRLHAFGPAASLTTAVCTA
jgi:hypothetical protein